MSGELRSVALLGEDHTELGATAVEIVQPGLAVGLSRGRFPKGYPHVDPNEDAVFGAAGSGLTVLAVADGHNGADAATAAIDALADAAPRLVPGDPAAALRHLTAAVADSVDGRVAGLPEPRDASRTALTIAVLAGFELATASFGDTACLIVHRRRVLRLGASAGFLAPGTDPAAAHVSRASLPPGAMVVLASDGLLDFVPHLGRLLRTLASSPAPIVVERLLAAAFAGGAGDNLAVAVYVVPRRRR